MYRFLSNPKYDWQSQMFYIATFIIRFICELNKNNKNLVNCLIVDDTMIKDAEVKRLSSYLDSTIMLLAKQLKVLPIWL